MDQKRPTTIIRIIRPILRVNQLFGVCPHEISGGVMIFRWKSFHVFHTLASLLLLTAYFIYMVVQFGLSFPRKRTMPEKVSIALWLGGTLVPIAMLIVTFIKRERFTYFFEKIHEYKEPLRGFMKCEGTLAYSRRLYGFYVGLCVLSCSCVATTIVQNPKADISILAYFSDTPSDSMVALACVFQCYLVIVKSCSSVFIEVLCSSLATSFYNTIFSIKNELHRNLNMGNQCSRSQRPFSSVQNNNRINGVSPLKEMMNHPHIHKIKEQKDLYPVIPTDENGDFKFSLNPYKQSDGFGSNYTDNTEVCEGAGAIMLAIKRYNCIANMQRVINCIFGPLLAIDSAFLVFMTCLLLYLQINYLGSGYLDRLEGIVFTGNFFIFSVRLINTFTVLGNIHDISVCFNGILTSSLMQAKKPKIMDVNLILAHLSTNSSFPVAFSAAGFFIFSKSSLLAVFSGIMTYVVFLLQAKN